MTIVNSTQIQHPTSIVNIKSKKNIWKCYFIHFFTYEISLLLVILHSESSILLFIIPNESDFMCYQIFNVESE